MADSPQPEVRQDDEPNPFAERLAADPSLGEVSLAERARLNAFEGAFRSTISGSTDLVEFKRALPDQYERITRDLARYESMKSFEGPLEGTAALAGQLYAGLTSPEGLITRVPGVASLAERLAGGVAGRIAGAGASQAVVQGVVNPVVQTGEMQTGMRKEFSKSEAALAVAGGAALGGALHAAGEGVGALARAGKKPTDAQVDAAVLAKAEETRAAETRNMAALAAEDPSLRAGGDRADMGNPITEQDQPLKAGSEGPASTDPVVRESRITAEAPAMDAPAVVADPDAAAARAAVDVPAPLDPPQPGETFAAYTERVAPGEPIAKGTPAVDAWNAEKIREFEAKRAGASPQNELAGDTRPAPAAAGGDQAAPPQAERPAPRTPGLGEIERDGTIFRDTRGAGVQYHGTSAADLRPSDDHYSTLNYYGQGFYTTDAADVGFGYSKRGSRQSGERNIYTVKENRPLKLYDAEQPIHQELRTVLEPKSGSGGGLDDVVDLALSDEPKNLRELYDNIREHGSGEGYSADTIQEIFDVINEALRNLGYDGLTHLGGLRTKTKPHRVAIYFSPEKDVTLTKGGFEAFHAPEPVPAEAASPQSTAESPQSAPEAVQSTPAAVSSSGKPLSLTQFIARNGGLALDGEASARDLGKVFIPGGGPLARARGKSIDGFWREALIDRGYLPADADGMASRNIERELFDAIDRERRGDRLYSAHDDVPETVKVDTQAREIEGEARKITQAIKKVGLRAGDVDQRTMMDAAEMLWRGDADDPLVALEHAMMAGEAGPAQREQGQMVEGLEFRKKAGGALGKVSAALNREPKAQAARAELAGLLKGEASDLQFRRATDNATPRRLTFDGPLSGERRITRAQAERELIERHDQIAEMRKDGGAAERIAPIQAQADALEKLLPKFEADLPRGRPFQPAKTIEAGDRFTVRLQDKGEQRTYRIYERGEDGAATGRPVGYVDLAQHPDGRWEADMLQVSPQNRGQGAASALYKAVEGDVGREMSPSGILLPDGYAFWKKRDPEAVRFHQKVGDTYLSPKRITAYLADGAHEPERVALQAALDKVPAEGKTPEAMALQFRNREPAAGGEPGRPGPPDAQVAAAAESPASEPLRSLQQQAQDLADALDVPLRQGRVQGGKDALGQFRQSDEVVRVRNTADFETVAHEAGHVLEKRIGEPLGALIRRFAAELGPIDYDPQLARPNEGFSEWVRFSMMNPPYAQSKAPGFTAAFRTMMQAEAPDLLAKIDSATAAHRAYLDAPTGEKLEAMVRKPEDEGVVRSIRRDGLPSTIGLYLTRAYEAVFDDKAPAARAVRSMTKALYQATGERVRLEGADNPENLVRLFARAQQAAVQDMREGVRPYRGIAPDGPSMRDALITATGEPGILGRWNAPAVEAFDRYLVARRAEVLYRRFAAGEMERRPVALSPEEVRTAIADLEAANPSFKAGADQIHGFTRQLLRKQYEGGLIDADLYGRLMAEEFYVPLYRHMDERPEGLGGGSGGSDGPGTVDTIKRLRGSDRDVIPPTQSLMTQAFLVNRTLQHNDIIKSFVALARQAREAGAQGVGRILEEIPPTQMVGKRFDLSEAVAAAARQAGTAPDDMAVLNGALTDVFGNDPIMATIFRAEPTGKRGEPLVFYKDGGQLRAVRLQSKDEGLALYETLSSLPPVARDFALQFGAATSSLLRTGIVTNPTFALTNFFRDQLAVGALRSDYVPFVSGLRGVASEMRQDQWASLYAYGGGVSPGAGSAGLSELIDRDVSALARKGWVVQKLGGLADLQRGHLLGPLKAGAEVVETAEAGTRLAVMKSVFEAKKGQGLSDYDALIEAAAQATDVMDFGRHGSGTLYLRTLVPFLNAHLQGLDKARRTLIEPLWRAARDGVVSESDAAAVRNAGASWFKVAGVGGALGTMYGLYASGHEAYRDANEELRATHLIIPGDAFGRPGKILVLPKPFELAMGFNLGEAVGLRIATGDPRAAHFAMDGVREVIQPPNPLTGIPLVKTTAELALNRSFFTGRDIVPENLQNRENPRFEVKQNTSSLAKAIGNALNISPIKVDYAVGSMFGNWGRDLMSVSNQADPNAPAAASEDTMFFRRFIKGADRTSETTKLFWEQAAQRNGAFAQSAQRYGDMLKGFQDREAADYLGALSAAQRAYVILSQGGDDSGKAAFKADEKRLHPITRGATAVQVVGGLIKELTNNSQKTFEDGGRIDMNPQKRRDVIDALRVLQAIEQRNAMVLTGQKGYEGRPLISAEDQFKVLKAQAPNAADELSTRYATMKVLPTETVARLWPQAQKALLADGTQADIRDLGLEAKSDGWAFGGDAVKRPQRRRLSIDPSAAPPPPTTGRRAPALSVPKDNPVPNPF